MTIAFSDFKKVDLKVGKVLKVEEIEGLDKLYKLTVDVGEEDPRTILAGVKEFISPQELEGKNVIVVANLEPKKIRDIESQGMVLAAQEEGGSPILIVPEGEVSPGATVL